MKPLKRLKKAGEKLQFRRKPDLRLIVTKNMRRRLKPLITAQLRILVDEYIFPRHEDVVVNDKGIGLVEPRRQRVVENTGGGTRVRTSGMNFHSRRIRGYDQGDGVPGLTAGVRRVLGHVDPRPHLTGQLDGDVG